jgi:hypothetical protein
LNLAAELRFGPLQSFRRASGDHDASSFGFGGFCGSQTDS